jgi:type I restriction enzyme S subunit
MGEEVKILVTKARALKNAGRWDIDFHLPPVGIRAFPEKSLVPVRQCAEFSKMKRDPGISPEAPFKYVDISSVDVETGIIARPQELTGEEAPSRARKVIRAYDIIISTCRPTRGAIAVIPEDLHGEICSTGFSVIRARPNVNPFYLHFALRLESTLEQFRKWSTGSSYPAILDEDVARTLIPLPDAPSQDAIARLVRLALATREKAIMQANQVWNAVVGGIMGGLTRNTVYPAAGGNGNGLVWSIKQIEDRVARLRPIKGELSTVDEELLERFDEDEEKEEG